MAEENKIDWVKDLQRFLEKKVFPETDTVVQNQMMDDAENLAPDVFLSKYDQFLQDNSEGWSEFRGKAKDSKTRVSEAFNGVTNPSDNYFDEVYSKNLSDIPKNEVKAHLYTLNTEKGLQNSDSKKDVGKMERAAVLRNYPIFSAMLPEDVKRRYVENPEQSSIYGAQKGDFSGYLDETDMLLGAAGAAADFLPGWYGILAGPGLRTVRNLKNYALDKSYNKSLSDIAKEGGADLFINASTDFLPTRVLNTIGRGSSAAARKLGGWIDRIKGEVNAIDAEKKINDVYAKAAEIANKEGEDYAKALAKGAGKKEAEQEAFNSVAARKTKDDLSKDLSELGLKDEVEAFGEEYIEGSGLPNDLSLSTMDFIKNLSSTPDVYKEGKLIGGKVIDTGTERAISSGLGENALKYRKLLEEAADASKIGKVAYAATKVAPGVVKNTTRMASEDKYKDPEEKKVDPEKAARWKDLSQDTTLQKMWKGEGLSHPITPNKKEGDDLWEAYQIWLKSQGGK